MKIIIGFDGLHRSGKGTQISLLQSKLEEQNIPWVLARGDGTRRGIGSKPFDYPSNWWKEKWEYFNCHSEDLSELEKINLKFYRLNREAKVHFSRTLDKKMKCQLSNRGVIILDRTLPSRYLTMLSFDPKINFEDAIKIPYTKNGLKISPIKPDLVYIINAPKEVLIKRLIESTKDQHDFNFKYNIIQKYYNTFFDIAKELCKLEGYKMLDGTRSPLELSKIVWEDISRRIEYGK